MARAICRDFGRNPDAWADAGVPVWRKYIGNAHNVLAEQDKEGGTMNERDDVVEAACRAWCISRGLEPDALHQGDEYPPTEQLANGTPAYRAWRKQVPHISAALDAADRARWRPMETCPTDGHEIEVLMRVRKTEHEMGEMRFIGWRDIGKAQEGIK